MGLAARLRLAAREEGLGDSALRACFCGWIGGSERLEGADAVAELADGGADGVEVDMGGLGARETFDNQLTNSATCQQFLAKAKELGLEIPSLAMTGFFAQSFAERPTVPRMIQDCVDTMTAMNVKVAFLRLGVNGDLV